MNNVSWALSCIQTDLRHHIGRLGGSTYLDGRCSTRFQDVIRCDEGGWVHTEDLVRMEVLWTAQSGYRVYSIRFDKNCIRFVFLVIMILFSLRAPLFLQNSF